ncbi:MAG: bifunctional (p)ppGpp synthetase/guanosine-3,5-bis(diphosphate) 3-pyrophosphohydrolase [Akkermansiaceae bacterium]|nr:bifunctional (p)ppGpp synthetase/guanosine-3,5-bis(diphosphate) 3-pyrophosphohydrolase [Akkermansiaceae bacterium]
MSTQERALQIAAAAHAGQTDKNGEAYIFHPIRVMSRCSSPDAKIAALLHDVVEDTSVTFAQLAAEGFSPGVLATLRLLTRPHDVSYDDYLTGILTDPVAIEVKIADLEDNSDIRRFPAVDEHSLARIGKYLAAYRRLTGKPA